MDIFLWNKKKLLIQNISQENISYIGIFVFDEIINIKSQSILNSMKKKGTYWLAATSSFTWSRLNKKNLSSSVLSSRMFLASRFTLFISLVFSSITLWSFVISTREASFSVSHLLTTVFFSVSNSLTTWLRDFSSVFIFSFNYKIEEKKSFSKIKSD